MGRSRSRDRSLSSSSSSSEDSAEREERMQRERDDREGGGAPRRSGGLGRYLALSGAIWRYLAISFYLILFRVDLTKEPANLGLMIKGVFETAHRDLWESQKVCLHRSRGTRALGLPLIVRVHLRSARRGLRVG